MYPKLRIIGKITLPFTDIGKSRPCHNFLTSQICVLTRTFPNLPYMNTLLKNQIRLDISCS